MDALNSFLSPFWSHNNPIDILGDAGAECYSKATALATADPGVDGTLVILTPQAMTEVEETAAALAKTQREHQKPLLACWMGGESMIRARNLLNQANIPTFDYPDTAVQAYAFMWQYSQNLRALYETPSSDPAQARSVEGRDRVSQLISLAQAESREFLTPSECSEIFGVYHLPTLPLAIAESPEEAALAAVAMGFPVVVKLNSKTLTHKTDVGGVRLNLQSPAEVEQAFRDIQRSVSERSEARHFQGVLIQPMIKSDGYEVILGSSVDPQFGPVILFGTGGQLVEVWQDRVLGLPPLNTTLARRMVERTRIFKALKGVRGRPPVDLDALDQLLVRFSQLVLDHPVIKEIDINPLLASAHGFQALDVRIVIHPGSVPIQSLPRPAIRPYPSELETWVTLKDSSQVFVRPIRPEDEPTLVEFHKTLSEKSVYSRYLTAIRLDDRIAHDRLTRICFNDYDRELALVASVSRPDGSRSIIAVGRLCKAHGHQEAELAVLVTDAWQGKGLGSALVAQLLQFARAEKLRRVFARLLVENAAMHHVCLKAGFVFNGHGEQSEALGEVVLST